MKRKESEREALATAGALCRQIRKKAHLSQQEIAKKFGCSQNAISVFERGKNNSFLMYFKYMKLKESNDWTERA